MGTVTATFAKALVRAAGFELSADGVLRDGETALRRFEPFDGQIPDRDYFELVDWIRLNAPNRPDLPFAYARAVKIDNLGTLGLAIKTAPKLANSMHRIERYFRILTDTVSYQLETQHALPRFVLRRETREHPALNLRNECALCGFGRIFKEIVGQSLSYDFVSFRHSPSFDVASYEAFFDCPVRFGAEQNAIALKSDMLELPTRLGDPAVSRFLTAHLDAELGSLKDTRSFERDLAEHLSQSLSSGIPKAAQVAKDMGVSERTLFRRLSDAGLTYQDVLENTQKSLAETLLSQAEFSITDVAFLTGFAEQSSFSRAFKRWVGQTPGAYRKAGAQPA